MKISFILFWILISLPGHSTESSSGQERGNGGDIIQCGQNFRVLDYFEFEFYYQFANKRVVSKASVDQIIYTLLSTLENKDVYSYNQLIHLKNYYFENMTFVNGIKPIDDSNHRPIRRNCLLHQGARFYIKNDQLYYEINKKLWSKLNNINKAGLILHEIIYTYFLLEGYPSSLKARDYHRLLVKMLLAPNVFDYQTYLDFFIREQK